MKKITLILFFVLPALAVNAQTEQGRAIVGGDVSFDFGTDKTDVGGTVSDDGKFTTINFSPRFGLFIMDGLAVGAEIVYQSYTFKPDGGGGDFKSNGFLFGPFVKYYLDNGLFGQAILQLCLHFGHVLLIEFLNNHGRIQHTSEK